MARRRLVLLSAVALLAAACTTKTPDRPPIARAGGDQLVFLGDPAITLDGSASADPDPDDAIRFEWRVLSAPANAGVTVGSAGLQATLPLDATQLSAAGNYVFSLTVTDKSGLTASDVVGVEVRDSLHVTQLLPAGDSATQVAGRTPLVAIFSQPVRPWTTGTAFDVEDVSDSANPVPVDGNVTLDLGGTAVVFTPVQDWTAQAVYQLRVTHAPVALDGAPMRDDVQTTFTGASADLQPPTVLAISPADQTTNQPLGSAVQWIFSEPIDPASVNGASVSVTVGGATVDGVLVLSSSGVLATFEPGSQAPFVPQPLVANQTYVATILNGGVADLFGNPLAADATTSFTTTPTADTTAPTVVSISPIRGANGISVKLPTVVTFSEPINPTTLTTSSLTLGTGGTGTVAGSVYTTLGNTVAVFQPASNLSKQVTYDVGVAGSVTDLSGNAMTQFSSFFRTGSAPPPSVNLVSPALSARGSNVVVDVFGSDFVDGATAFLTGLNGNVFVTQVTTLSDSQLQASLTLAPGAQVGPRSLVVKNPDGQEGTGLDVFRVLDFPPTIASVTPGGADRGDSGLTLDVLGANFRPGATLSVSGSGITLGSTTVVSAGELRATLSVSATALTGARDVTVTEADGQSATATGALTIRLQPPVVTSINPNTGGQGATIAGVLVLGTNFQTTPSFPTVAMGSGVLASTVTATATQITINVSVAGNATLGTNDIVVTNADGQSTTLVKGFVVQRAPPSVTSASPALSRQGGATLLTVNGTSFDCTGNGPTLVVGNGGTAATGITVDNSGAPASCSTTQVARNVTVAATASAPALQGVRVTNPDGQFGDAANAVSIRLEAPAFTSASTAVRVNTTTPVTITGDFFQISPLPTVAFGGGALSSVSAATATTITATVSVPTGATPNTYPVVITNADGQQVTGSYTIAPPNPTVTGVSPSPIDRGTTQPITVTGTDIQCPATFSFTPATGITVGTQVTCTTTSVTHNVTFASPATAPSSYSVLLTNADGGTGTLANALTVRLEAPTFTNTNPTSVRIGAPATVTVNGSFFQTSPFPTVAFGGGALSTVTGATPTTITTTVSVPSGATPGSSAVVITNADGQQVTGSYTIAPPNPSITSVSPSTVDRGGAAQSITVNGTDILCPATLAITPSTANITMGSEVSCSATSEVRNVTFASGTTPGSYSVQLTNFDGGVSNTLSSALTVRAEAPTIASLSPLVSGHAGTAINTTINGTFFQLSPSVSFGAGVAVTVGAVTATTIQVTLTIDPAATIGTRDVTVTNADGQSITKSGAFNVQLPNPTLTDLVPSFGSRGSTVTGVLIDGGFFQCSGSPLPLPVVTINDPHITISNVTCDSGNTNAEGRLKADFNLTSSLSTPGSKNVTVTNADGGTVTLNGAFTEKLEPPQAASYSVAQGRRNQTLSTVLTGSFFQNPATASFAGGGIGVGSTTFTDSSHLTVNLSIDPNASRAPATRQVTVTNPDGQFNASSPTFTIQRAFPTVAGTSPIVSAPRQSTVFGLPINGKDFDCSGAPGVVPAVVFNKSTDGSVDADITVTNVSCGVSTSDQATQLTADVTFGALSAPTLKSITVTNPTVGGDDKDSGSSGLVFTLQQETPLLTSTSPAVAQGATTDVTLLGRYFQNTPALPVVSEPAGSDYTVNSVVFVSSTNLTVNVSVPLSTALGTYALKLLNPDGQSVSASLLQVVTAPPPSITAVVPGKGAQGQTVPISITGANLQSGATASFNCSGSTTTVTASGYGYAGVPTGITANVSVGAGAAIGPCDVTVTNPVGTSPSGTLAAGFHVTGPTPKVTSLSPSSGLQGANITTLLVLGSNFRATPTLAFSPADVTVNSVTFTNGTALTANVTISAVAVTAPHDVTVTDPDTAAGTLTGGFTVNSAGGGPSVNALVKEPTRTSSGTSSSGKVATRTDNPFSLRDGETGRFHITGSNFVSGATVTISGAGVLTSNATFVSASRIDVTIKVDPGCTLAGSGGAATGVRDVTVTNPGGITGTLANGFLVRNGIVINEVVTHPRVKHLFNANNEEIELYNGSQCAFDLSNWRFDFHDFDGDATDSYLVGSGNERFSAGSSLVSLQPNGYYGLSNPEAVATGLMSDSVFILLTTNTGRFIDSVEISANGVDPAFDGSGTNGAPDGTGTGGLSSNTAPNIYESVGRTPNGNDTDANIVDFYKDENGGNGMGFVNTDVTNSAGAQQNANNCVNSATGLATGNCPVCSNGLDDDNDGWVDALDPGCYAGGVYNPNGTSEGGFSATFTCNDNADNDSANGKDAADPKCVDGFGSEN